MEFDAFSARLGLSQGRVEINGDHVFVLGNDHTGYLHDLKPGDFSEVKQESDLTDVDLVRADLVLRVPDSLPPEFYWEVSIVVSGNELAAATSSPGRTRQLHDLAANVSKLNGLHQVGVRLQLVES